MVWWDVLHMLLATAVLMANPVTFLALVLLSAIALHFHLRRPEWNRLLLISANGRFALPEQGRFNLTLAEPARCGSFWADLRLSDDPRRGVLLLRDQFTASQWRQFSLWLRES